MPPRDDVPSRAVPLMITVGRARALRDLLVGLFLLAAAGVLLFGGLPTDPAFVAVTAAFGVGGVAAAIAAAGVERSLAGRRLDPPVFRGVVVGTLAVGMLVTGVSILQSGQRLGWVSVAAGLLFVWLGIATVRRDRRVAVE